LPEIVRIDSLSGETIDQRAQAGFQEANDVRDRVRRPVGLQPDDQGSPDLGLSRVLVARMEKLTEGNGVSDAG
jgi:hypothetical protein